MVWNLSKTLFWLTAIVCWICYFTSYLSLLQVLLIQSFSIFLMLSALGFCIGMSWFVRVYHYECWLLIVSICVVSFILGFYYGLLAVFTLVPGLVFIFFLFTYIGSRIKFSLVTSLNFSKTDIKPPC